jgi:thiol:disulfide interchange protein DsbA
MKEPQSTSRSSLVRVALFALLMPLLAHAAPTTVPAAEPFEAGKHYFPLDQVVRVRDPNKIEVVEVFWYGCGHCFRFDPLVKAWQKTLPADIDFIRLPVIWNSNTELHAQMFYTAQSLGLLNRLHDRFFDVMNVQGNPLNTKDKVQEFFVNNGVKANEFDQAFTSFGVTSQVNQAKGRTLSYKVEGTPEMIVAGKYRVDGRAFSTENSSEQKSHEKMLEVVNFLIAKERQAKLGK